MHSLYGINSGQLCELLCCCRGFTGLLRYEQEGTGSDELHVESVQPRRFPKGS